MLKKIQTVITCSFAAMLLGACTVTGPADDGFANSHESMSIGRLFSDDDEGYTVFRSKKRQAGANDATNATSDTVDDAEYRAFREWSEARENDTPEYRKFKLWQEFESFQRWREQQDTD